MATTAARIDVLLSTLNATDIGTIDSIIDKIAQVRDELFGCDQPELAGKASDAIAALRRGDLVEFRRLRAFLQSKVGHLRA